MKELTDNLTRAFTQVINSIQEKASLQEIHRIDEMAKQISSFIAFSERVWDKQNKVGI